MNDPSEWIAVTLLPGFGPVATRRALDRWSDPATVAYRAPAVELARLARSSAARIADARRDLRRRADRELRRARSLGVRLLTLDDDRYPAELRQLDDAPPVIFMYGELDPGRTRVAIVGSRRATRYGSRVAAGLASGLALRGIDVVSGGARGIDAAAHRGAIDAEAATVAVLGSGLARPYPPEHAGLFAEIRRRGALISELPLDAPPLREHFPRRNRLIAGLAAAVVVVEAAARSGSLITAGLAAEQGKEVLAVPGPVDSPVSAGCHRLIRDGAVLISTIDDLVEGLSPMYRGAIGPAPPAERPPTHDPAAPLEPDEAAVLSLLDPVEPLHLDELAEMAPFGIARLQTAVFGLELSGRVEALPGGRYKLAST